MNEYINKLNNKMDNQKDISFIIDEMKEYAIKNNVPIIQNDSIMVVLSIINAMKAKKILEIGTAIGYSALMFASSNNNISVDTIERDEKMYDIAIKNIKKANYNDKIRIFFNDALLIDNAILNPKYDVIFIDAAKAQYQKFFTKYIDLLSNNGVVITDNILFHGCVEELILNENSNYSKNVKNMVRKLDDYNNFLSSLKEFNTYYLNVGDGLAITVKKCE